MNFEVLAIPLFEKQAKRLLKKYPSLKKDLGRLIDGLISNPEQGTPLGDNFYKIRLAITSKNKGKSGGARVITHVKVVANRVYLSAIYDKSEQVTITSEELKNVYSQIPE